MEKIELTKIINKCYESVQESILGEIITKKEDGSFMVNSIPYQTYLQVLGSELPHVNITSVKQTGNLDMKLEEPGDTWKKS